MIGDLHFGHKNIQKFRKDMGFANELEHRHYVMEQWNKTVTKRDKVYVLGDACFTMEAIEDIGNLNGTKILIRGNHDNLNTSDYLKVFKEVEGIVRYKHAWLTHAPIHPDELRGKVNIHGHVHCASIDDNRYENVCLENVNYKPIEWFELIEKKKRTNCETSIN